MLKWAYKKQLEDRLKLEGTNGYKHSSSYPGRQYFQSRRGKISEQIKEEFLCDACSKSVTDQYFTAGKVFFKCIEGINNTCISHFSEKLYHPECFKCQLCGSNIESEYFLDEEGHIICSRSHDDTGLEQV